MKADAQVAHDWYRLQLSFLLERNSTLAGNALGFLGIGLYESVRHGIKNAVSFSTVINQMPAMPDKDKNNGYHWDISANAAMAAMLRSFNIGLTPANKAAIDALEAKYNAALNPSEGSASFERSQAYGREIAKAIYDWYLADQYYASNAGYVPPVDPAGIFRVWKPTPPANVPVPIFPYLGTSRTFLTVHTSLTAPAFPIAYSGVPGSDFYNMVKEVYDVSLTLDDDKKALVNYFKDVPGYSPGGTYVALMAQAIENTKQTLDMAALTYVKVGLAQHDATIVLFTHKYLYNIIRPVTYIRAYIDPNWLTYIPTPNHPEFPSGHSTTGGAVLGIMSSIFGEDFHITLHTYDGIYPSRSYSSFTQMLKEISASRLYGGIHFQATLDKSEAQGNRVAQNILNTIKFLKG